jgi:hypothetical protein
VDGEDGLHAQGASREQKRPHFELSYKRLEAGTFQFAFVETGGKEIAAWEPGVLLEGIDLTKGRRRKRYSLRPSPIGNGQGEEKGGQMM